MFVMDLVLFEMSKFDIPILWKICAHMVEVGTYLEMKKRGILLIKRINI